MQINFLNKVHNLVFIVKFNNQTKIPSLGNSKCFAFKLIWRLTVRHLKFHESFVPRSKKIDSGFIHFHSLFKDSLIYNVRLLCLTRGASSWWVWCCSFVLDGLKTHMFVLRFGNIRGKGAE